jgi:hypothetical protein
MDLARRVPKLGKSRASISLASELVAAGALVSIVQSLARAMPQDEEWSMSEKQTQDRARQDKAKGKAPTTQAGEFVREEIHHVREGKHGARSPQQAIAIGLSKARRAGVNLPPPKAGRTSKKTRRSAERAYHRGQGDHARSAPSPRRSRAIRAALKRERHSAASSESLAEHGRSAAARRTRAGRSAAAKKGVQTKGAAGRSASARKAARTRAAKHP